MVDPRAEGVNRGSIRRVHHAAAERQPQTTPATPPALGPDPRLVATGADPADLLIAAALRAGRWRNGRYAKRENGAFVYLGALELKNGETAEIALKRVHTRPAFIGRLQTRFSRNRAQREWRGALLLREKGIPAARPIALFRHGRTQWTLAFERIEGPTALHLARSGDPAQRRALAHSLGRLVARLSAAAIFNRDCKLSNLIVRTDGDIATIDCVGVRSARITTDLRRRMLAAMLYEAHGTRSMGTRANRLRVLKAAGESDWKSAWRDLERRLRAHGDTRPRTDPLT